MDVEVAGHDLGRGGSRSRMRHVMHGSGNQSKLLNIASVEEVDSSLGGLT